MTNSKKIYIIWHLNPKGENVKHISKQVLTKTSFALATSLMLVSCGSSSSSQAPKPIPNKNVVYICADGKSTAKGSSWEDCRSDIVKAIEDAQKAKKNLWFKAGTYKLNGTMLIDKEMSLYGGFNGTESKLSDRKLVKTSPTVLSGENKMMVLVTSAVSARSVVDGFVITKGHSTGQNGAGMDNIKDSNITVQNVVFRENTGKNGASAVRNNNASPTLVNVSFVQNSTNTNGGAMYNKNSNAKIVNASFVKNSTDANGGAVHNEESNTTFANVTFSENSAANGGAVSNRNSRPEFINTTFSKNSVTSSGDVFYDENSKSVIFSSIVWDNGTNTLSFDAQSKPFVKYSILQNINLSDEKYKNKDNSVGDPLLEVAKATINGVEHVYYGLKDGSPAIDKGDASYMGNFTFGQVGYKFDYVDQLGNNRLDSTTGNIDMGAIEKQK